MRYATMIHNSFLPFALQPVKRKTANSDPGGGPIFPRSDRILVRGV